MSGTTPAPATFSPRVMLWAVLGSLFAAAAFFVLSTYAPAFRLAGPGGATPTSKSGIGFAGLGELLTIEGQSPRMARQMEDLDDPALLIVPLAIDTDPQALATLVRRRQWQTTLFVLPKWRTVSLRGHSGWESKIRRLTPQELDPLIARLANTRIGTTGPAATRTSIGGHAFTIPDVQWMPDTDRPVVGVGPRQSLVAIVNPQPHFILTDPDLIDNAGLADPERAAAAMALIRKLRPNGDPVMFDMTLLDGASVHGRDLNRLLIEPPFLALTLSLLFAAALAFFHGFVGFGPPLREERAIAFGKYALADVTARLLRRAGRLGEIGGDYAQLMRARAAALLGAPAGLRGAALDGWLNARDSDQADGFTARAAAVAEARAPLALLTAAGALNRWIRIRRRGEQGES